MGMFTSITHPKDGRELQIKTGFDDCQTYKVGNEVPWEPSKYNPGSHIDGAHQGYSSENGWDDWVIIKDKKIQEVVPNEEGLTATSLEDEFCIAEPSRSLWSDEDWDAYDALKRESRERYQQYEKLIAKSDISSLGEAMAFPITRNLNYPGIARRILDVKPLPGGPISKELDTEE